VGFVVDKAALEQVSSSPSISPANHFDCSTPIIIIIIIIIIYHAGLVQRAKL
jgi:hypothetical protein